MVLLHLDAHADLRDGFLGYHYSHASIIRRSVDHFGPCHELIQYGIRSGTRDEYLWMKEHKTIRSSRKDFLDSVEAIAKDRPVYLTLDLDYFDPSFLRAQELLSPAVRFPFLCQLDETIAQKHGRCRRR